MTELPPSKSINDPFDEWSIQTSREAIKRSRELLEGTKAMVGSQRYWPVVRGQGKTRP